MKLQFQIWKITCTCFLILAISGYNPMFFSRCAWLARTLPPSSFLSSLYVCFTLVPNLVLLITATGLMYRLSSSVHLVMVFRTCCNRNRKNVTAYPIILCLMCLKLFSSILARRSGDKIPLLLDTQMTARQYVCTAQCTHNIQKSRKFSLDLSIILAIVWLVSPPYFVYLFLGCVLRPDVSLRLYLQKLKHN